MQARDHPQPLPRVQNQLALGACENAALDEDIAEDGQMIGGHGRQDVVQDLLEVTLPRRVVAARFPAETRGAARQVGTSRTGDVAFAVRIARSCRSSASFSRP